MSDAEKLKALLEGPGADFDKQARRNDRVETWLIVAAFFTYLTALVGLFMLVTT